MTKKIVLGFIAALLLPAAAVAKEPPALDYHGMLMEYYAGYRGTWGDTEVEECYIAFHPGLYAAHEKNEADRIKDRELVRGELGKAVPDAAQGAHEYLLLLHAQLGEQDEEHSGFRCDFIEARSCIELGPLQQNMAEGRERAIVVCGLVFDRVHAIRLFFANTGEYNFLKLPAGKMKRFLKARAGAGGALDKTVYIKVALTVLPGGDPRKKQLDDMLKDADLQGMASNYFMLAAINRIEVYDDAALSRRLGNVEYYYRTLDVVH